MSTDLSEAGIVVPFPGSATLSPSPRPEARRPPGLDPGVSVERDWPVRTALVVGAAPHPTVLEVLQRHDIGACVAPVAQVDALLPTAGPFTFLLLGADVLSTDTRVEQVRAWHLCSPSARVTIVARPGDLAPATARR